MELNFFGLETRKYIHVLSPNKWHRVLSRILWDPNFSPFCNEIPLLNGTDLTQILWDPSWKKKEDLTSISEKVNICYTFDEKKVNNNFFGFLANFDHLEEMSQISKNLVNFTCIWSNLHYYYKTFFQNFPKNHHFYQKWRKSTKNP